MKAKIIAAALAISVAAPALADPPPWAPAHGRRDKDARAWYADHYYREGRYYKPRRLSYGDRIYRGENGRYYCKRPDGTTGLILGAIGGGLLGNAIAPGDSKTVGTIVGGSLGAVIGRAIERDGVECR